MDLTINCRGGNIGNNINIGTQVSNVALRPQIEEPFVSTLDASGEIDYGLTEEPIAARALIAPFLRYRFVFSVRAGVVTNVTVPLLSIFPENQKQPKFTITSVSAKYEYLKHLSACTVNYSKYGGAYLGCLATCHKTDRDVGVYCRREECLGELHKCQLRTAADVTDSKEIGINIYYFPEVPAGTFQTENGILSAKSLGLPADQVIILDIPKSGAPEVTAVGIRYTLDIEAKDCGPCDINSSDGAFQLPVNYLNSQGEAKSTSMGFALKPDIQVQGYVEVPADNSFAIYHIEVTNVGIVSVLQADISFESKVQPFTVDGELPEQWQIGYYDAGITLSYESAESLPRYETIIFPPIKVTCVGECICSRGGEFTCSAVYIAYSDNKISGIKYAEFPIVDVSKLAQN